MSRPEVNESHRALRAEEAGRYLAERIGLSAAPSRQRMWRLARLKLIESFHLGRSVYFTTDSLDRLVVSGGVTWPNRVKAEATK